MNCNIGSVPPNIYLILVILCVPAYPVESNRAEDVSQPPSYCHQRLCSCSGAAVSTGPNPQRPQLEGFQDGHEQGDISPGRLTLSQINSWQPQGYTDRIANKIKTWEEKQSCL